MSDPEMETKQGEAKPTETRAQDVYSRVKARVVGFEIRPGERLNEVALSRDLEASRTPLREALNRLMAERLVEFRPGAGFFCRALEPQAVFELYELRQALETTAVRLACLRADAEGLAALAEETHARGLSVAGLTVAEAVARDEAFHLGIARLAGNQEIVLQLENINDRIRFIRWTNLAARLSDTKGEHRVILAALTARDEAGAAALLSTHIARRMDQVIDAVKEGYSNIYMGGADALMSRVLEDG